jgi:hypothetical protein
VGRVAEDIRELSSSASGFISDSHSRRSTKGSTLQQWKAATTPAVVRPWAQSRSRALRRGCSLAWHSRVAPQR